jgi:hypothetical protein
MSQVLRQSAWIRAINVTDGTLVECDADGWVTLSANTWVFVLAVRDQPLESLNIITDATIAWSGLTIEDTNAPRNDGTNTAPGTITDWDNSADTTWTQENPSSAYVGTSGTGWTVTALTIAKTAGKGSAMIHLSNLGSARLRAKAVVTTGGKMRISAHGKS